VTEGDCVACHQPHGSDVTPFLRARPRELCTTCHASLARQLAEQIPHAPLTNPDGCQTCHGSHTTRHPALLSASLTTTCLDCHDGADADFVDEHLGLAAETLDCTGCHDPHASPLAGMLLPEVHPPFGEGDCAICHTETSEGN
jgi:predicted CXXCH cytochrome family protein